MSFKNPKNPNSPLKNTGNSSNSPVENLGKKNRKSNKNNKKSTIVFASLGLLGVIGGSVGLVFGLVLPSKEEARVSFPKIPSEHLGDEFYSHLTGLPLADASQVTAPAYCIQTPNGTDGARPHAGLNEAGVVFEAIAESGITRFAAIYQDPTAAVIGPIRSLRIYYLEWDTPFDCTIVHAGGSGDALAAVANGYKDLTEDYSYMYRGTTGTRLWNNLFTTSAYLKKMSADRGYTSSDIKGFLRMTPEESLVSRVNSLVEESLVIYEASSGKTMSLVPKASAINIDFGGWPDFNVRYNYDPASNTYLRSYASGDTHDVYNCPTDDLGEVNPESSCTLKQLAPSVVVAMEVAERRAQDNYHEDITTVGSGNAHIFQNGLVVKGTWQKSSVAEQIKFYDENGTEIALAPGQTFVEAVPEYGSVEYQ